MKFLKPAMINKFFHQNFTINHYDQISSTNDLALELIRNNQIQENQVIICNSQTSGKGRIGRNWVSPNGNLYFSLILKTPQNINSSNLSFLAAVALGEALNLDQINYKWPNDILLQGKKIAGILIEKDANFIVLGVGVNLISNPEQTNYPSVNLKDCGINLEKIDLLKSFLDKFSNLNQEWLNFGFAPIRNLWLKKAFNLGKKINIRLKDGSSQKCPSGIFLDLDQDGNLVLNVEGQNILISSGEIF